MTRRMQSDSWRASIPRYRVEERSLELATLIVGFADTPVLWRSLLLVRASQLTRKRRQAELVVIEQETESVIDRCDVIPGSFRDFLLCG